MSSSQGNITPVDPNLADIFPMDYNNIPEETRKYIRESTYIGMDEEGRKLYLESTKELIRKLDKSSNDGMEKSSNVPCSSVIAKPNFIDVEFVDIVGMDFFYGVRIFGERFFTICDKIRLEKDDDGYVYTGAVKVMVYKSSGWKHVANVDRDSAKRLQTIDGFEDLPLRLFTNSGRVIYRIDLRPLEGKDQDEIRGLRHG
ncbi:hypothetical protein BGX26_000328 [Mortierella sp. AD094]|nr:hypothetical protein BGX26_000328 [Mortierella sp. AD094]